MNVGGKKESDSKPEVKKSKAKEKTKEEKPKQAEMDEAKAETAKQDSPTEEEKAKSETKAAAEKEATKKAEEEKKAAETKAAEEKAAAKKAEEEKEATAKKAAEEKEAAKKAEEKKAAEEKEAAKKAEEKKAAEKKAAEEKEAAKKAEEKKAAEKKAAEEKEAAKKAEEKKAAEKKAAEEKEAAKKAEEKKAAEKKAAEEKAAAKHAEEERRKAEKAAADKKVQGEQVAAVAGKGNTTAGSKGQKPDSLAPPKSGAGYESDLDLDSELEANIVLMSDVEIASPTPKDDAPNFSKKQDVQKHDEGKDKEIKTPDSKKVQEKAEEKKIDVQKKKENVQEKAKPQLNETKSKMVEAKESKPQQTEAVQTKEAKGTETAQQEVKAKTKVETVVEEKKVPEKKETPTEVKEQKKEEKEVKEAESKISETPQDKSTTVKPEAKAPQAKQAVTKPEAKVAQDKPTIEKPEAKMPQNKPAETKTEAKASQDKQATPKPGPMAPQDKPASAKPEAKTPQNKPAIAKPEANTPRESPKVDKAPVKSDTKTEASAKKETDTASSTSQKELPKKEIKETTNADLPPKEFTAIPDDFYNTIFYFSGMGCVIGSALAEGVYVPNETASAALDADEVTDVKNKRMGKSGKEETSVIENARHQANDLTGELRNLQALLESLPTFVEQEGEEGLKHVKRRVDQAIQARYQQFASQQEANQRGRMPEQNMPPWEQGVQDGMKIVGKLPPGAQPTLPGMQMKPATNPDDYRRLKEQQEFVERQIQQQIQELKRQRTEALEKEAQAVQEQEKPHVEEEKAPTVEEQKPVDETAPAQVETTLVVEAQVTVPEPEQAPVAESEATVDTVKPQQPTDQPDAATADAAPGVEEPTTAQEFAPAAEPPPEGTATLIVTHTPQPPKMAEVSAQEVPVPPEVPSPSQVDITGENHQELCFENKPSPPQTPPVEACTYDDGISENSIDSGRQLLPSFHFKPSFEVKEVPVAIPPAPPLPQTGIFTTPTAASATQYKPHAETTPTKVHDALVKQAPSNIQRQELAPQSPRQFESVNGHCPSENRPAGYGYGLAPTPASHYLPPPETRHGMKSISAPCSPSPTERARPWEYKPPPGAIPVIPEVPRERPTQHSTSSRPTSLTPHPPALFKPVLPNAPSPVRPKLSRSVSPQVPVGGTPAAGQPAAYRHPGEFLGKQSYQPQEPQAPRPVGVHTAQVPSPSQPWQERYAGKKVVNVTPPTPFSQGVIGTEGLKPWQMSHMRAMKARGYTLTDPNKQIESDFFSMTLPQKQAPLTPAEAQAEQRPQLGSRFAPKQNQPTQGGARPYGVHVQLEVESKPYQDKFRDVRVADAKKPKPFAPSSGNISTKGLKPWQMSHLRTMEARGFTIANPEQEVEKDFFTHTLPEKQMPLPQNDPERSSMAPYLVSTRSRQRDFHQMQASTEHRPVSAGTFNTNYTNRPQYYASTPNLSVAQSGPKPFYGSAANSLPYSDL